jgi:hypothetical protein
MQRCMTLMGRSLVVGGLLVSIHSFTTDHLAAQAPATPQAAPADAPPIPSYEVRRAPSPINVDGVLDDAAWEHASVAAELHGLWDLQTGPRQATRARLLWDDNYLYLAYDVDDIDITAQYLNRDEPVYQDDAVEIFINPRPNQTSLYFGLEMSAREVIYDYVLYADARIFVKQYDMQGLLLETNLRGTMNVRDDSDAGWTLEVAIPWGNFDSMARRPSVGQAWKFQLNRWDGVQPNRRMSIWSDPLQTRAEPHVPARFGNLVFVD